MKKSIFILFLLFLVQVTFAQSTDKQYVYGLFRGTHVINGQSAETQKAGELDLMIAHRFGRLNSGFYEWFGLDQASMRLGFEYGITNWLAVGVGRSTVGKEYDSFIKARILQQSNTTPIFLTWYSGLFVNGTAPTDLPLPFHSRLSFSNQLIVARKFNDRLSVQVMPTHIHLNLVDLATDPNDIFSLGTAAKFQLTKNIGVTAEYYLTPFGQLATDKRNSLSFGFDINTGSHVFQIHFSNSSGMQEKAFVTNTTGEWGAGDIQFGFNMVRTFKLKGRRY
jgi:hypothetical protein